MIWNSTHLPDPFSHVSFSLVLPKSGQGISISSLQVPLLPPPKSAQAVLSKLQGKNNGDNKFEKNGVTGL